MYPEQFKYPMFPEIQPDEHLANYKILRVIGNGGIGKVYLAKHIWLNHQVAIKVHEDFPSGKEISTAFFRAASFLSQMQHPNIISFINFGVEGSRGFVVMEYIEGFSLYSAIDIFQTKSGVIRALRYFEQLLNAVRYAHNCSFLDIDNTTKRGIIHGDIKPHNVLISKIDSVKLTDFMVPDIQRFLAVRQHTRFSAAYAEHPTQAYGTPFYMAPEQADEGKVSELTDVFSLGVTLYHILTKKYPYRLVYETPYLEQNEKVKPVTLLNPYVSEWVNSIVLKATQLLPENRYQSVAEMQRDFLGFINNSQQKVRHNNVFQVGEQVIGQTNANVNTKTVILFLTADPTNASRLRLSEESREIQEKLQLANFRERFELHQRMSVRPADISQALLDLTPKIVHFSGHATSGGALCAESVTGEIHLISYDALEALFEQLTNQVQCVILNACYSKTQASAIAKHIDYVIGMNQAIGDRAAIAFAVGFYQALGAGRGIEESYRFGRVQIKLQGITEDLTPVLIKNGQIQQ